MNFQQKSENIKACLKALIGDKDVSDEILIKFNEIESNIDELATDYESLNKKHDELKDSYIKYVRGASTSEKPKDEIQSAKTLDEIADLIVKGGK